MLLGWFEKSWVLKYVCVLVGPTVVNKDDLFYEICFPYS